MVVFRSIWNFGIATGLIGLLMWGEKASADYPLDADSHPDAYARSTAVIRDVLTPGEDTSIVIVGNSQSVLYGDARMPWGIARTWPLDFTGWTNGVAAWNLYQLGFADGLTHRRVQNNGQYAPVLTDRWNCTPQVVQEITTNASVASGEIVFQVPCRASVRSLFHNGDWAAGRALKARMVYFADTAAALPTVTDLSYNTFGSGGNEAAEAAHFEAGGLNMWPQDGLLALPAFTGDVGIHFRQPSTGDGLTIANAFVYGGTYFCAYDAADPSQRIPGKSLTSISFEGWRSDDHLREGGCAGSGTSRSYDSDDLQTYLDACGVADREHVLCIVQTTSNDVRRADNAPEAFEQFTADLVRKYDTVFRTLGIEDARYLLVEAWHVNGAVDESWWDGYRGALFTLASHGIDAAADDAEPIPAERIAAVSLYHAHDGTHFGPLLDGAGIHPANAAAVDFFTGALWQAIQADPACPGDVDGDGMIELDDFFTLLQSWGSCEATCRTDTNMDGMVGLDDFFTLLQSWGTCD
jgi:hypothetical protein